MGSYSYCPVCDAGMARPTPSDCVIEKQICRNGHEKSVPNANEELASYLDDMFNLLNLIKEHIYEHDAINLEV